MSNTKSKRIRLTVILSLVLVFVVSMGILFFPYAKAEILTMFHKDEFEDQYEQIGWIRSIEYFRVISYNEKNATVIYIEEDHYGCFKVNFEFNDGAWKFTSFDCVWSATGSASGFMWPYYR